MSIKGETMKFNRTNAAAIAEKHTKWDLIAAIAEDAVENGLPITGVDSQLAAKDALEAADSEYTAATVVQLCLLAKFDHESTSAQRQVWRQYGWTVVRSFARFGVSQEAAAEYLGGERRTFRDVQALLRKSPVTRAVHSQPSIDDAWKAWLNAINRLLIDGAHLAERSETETEQLGVYSAAARLIYERITERKIDAEIRQFLDSAEVEA